VFPSERQLNATKTTISTKANYTYEQVICFMNDSSMNNGSMPMKGSQSRNATTTTTTTTRKTATSSSVPASAEVAATASSSVCCSDQDNSLELPDVSILSVGLTRYRRLDPGMLTDDDDDDQEVVRSVDRYCSHVEYVPMCFVHHRLKRVMKTMTTTTTKTTTKTTMKMMMTMTMMKTTMTMLAVTKDFRHNRGTH
jgi:hypothetical protein